MKHQTLHADLAGETSKQSRAQGNRATTELAVAIRRQEIDRIGSGGPVERVPVTPERGFGIEINHRIRIGVSFPLHLVSRRARGQACSHNGKPDRYAAAICIRARRDRFVARIFRGRKLRLSMLRKA